MSKFCKFCGTQMVGEHETLTSSHHYRVFFICPKCKAVYEGEYEEHEKNLLVSKSCWFNPNTNTYE